MTRDPVVYELYPPAEVWWDAFGRIGVELEVSRLVCIGLMPVERGFDEPDPYKTGIYEQARLVVINYSNESLDVQVSIHGTDGSSRYASEPKTVVLSPGEGQMFGYMQLHPVSKVEVVVSHSQKRRWPFREPHHCFAEQHVISTREMYATTQRQRGIVLGRRQQQGRTRGSRRKEVKYLPKYGK